MTAKVAPATSLVNDRCCVIVFARPSYLAVRAGGARQPPDAKRITIRFASDVVILVGQDFGSVFALLARRGLCTAGLSVANASLLYRFRTSRNPVVRAPYYARGVIVERYTVFIFGTLRKTRLRLASEFSVETKAKSSVTRFAPQSLHRHLLDFIPRNAHILYTTSGFTTKSLHREHFRDDGKTIVQRSGVRRIFH